MKVQSNILAFFTLQQASAFISNVPQKVTTSLDSTYNPMTAPQADTYRQTSPDMGYAVSIFFAIYLA